MITRRYLPGKMLLLLILAATLGGCTETMTDGGNLPDGKYPLEFTSQMYGMEVTRATPDNTWKGGEEIAIKVGNEMKNYTATSAGKITAKSGVTPFYWTSTVEKKNVSAIYPYTLASANAISVSATQNVAANYQASDALYAASTSIAFTASAKKLTFKHLPAKVVANLKAGDGVTATEVQGATVRFVSQSLSASFNNTTGAVATSSPGSSSITPNVLGSPANGFQKSVQALLLPSQMNGSKFIEVAIGSDTFYYTPTNTTDGKLESGKISTYEITVKRDGIEVKLIESNEWGDGGSEDITSRVLPSMLFVIDLTDYADKSYILPFVDWGKTGNYTLFVDWGDGNVSTITPNTSLYNAITHTYSNQTEYRITISTTEEDFSKKQIPDFGPGNYYQETNSNRLKLKKLLTPLLNTGGTYFLYSFYKCSKLTEISENLFVNNTQAINFSYCFFGCTELTGISEKLFANNTKAEDFSYCFRQCSALTEIPEKLFANNTQAINFSYCFYGCSKLTGIPEKLFAYNTQATNFSDGFGQCSGLTKIPADLFAKNTLATGFSGCFYGCSNLTEIPEKLFANNTKATELYTCFQGCSKLTGIPEKLFAYNTLVSSFYGCFWQCSSLKEIPPNLFATNTLATTFWYCFEECSSLTKIPENLFTNNVLATDFDGCFSDCSKLIEIPANLFVSNTKATTFSSCFYGCSTLKQIPENLFAYNTLATDFESCFSRCSKLTKIPAKLFANNTLATDFERCFDECNTLSGEIPEGLFANNKLATNFEGCFVGCPKLKLSSNIFCDDNNETARETRFQGQTVDFTYCFSNESSGTAPQLWLYKLGPGSLYSGCFQGTKVSNKSKIPDGWK